jgi:hypothetical protein|uniref:Uncharacterized protein n=1 Tax=Haptolina ericina TaxID=156174 RepID=A0A7S3AJM7_9EUKA
MAEVEGLLQGLKLSRAVPDFPAEAEGRREAQPTLSKDEFVAVVGAPDELSKESGAGLPWRCGASPVASLQQRNTQRIGALYSVRRCTRSYRSLHERRHRRPLALCLPMPMRATVLQRVGSTGHGAPL